MRTHVVGLADRTRFDVVEPFPLDKADEVFHREGEPIKCFRTAWRAACRRSGIARIPHDFRRTAARNMRRAGLAESDIMELCGWETRAMFEQYAIRDEAALGAAVKRYAAATPERRVLPFGPKRTQKAAQG